MNQEKFYHHLKPEGKKKIIFALLGVLIIFIIVLIVSTGVDIVNKIKNIRTRNPIVVYGIGEVYAKPDLALISFSVINEAKTAAQAMNENSAVMNEVIKAVKEQGVEDKDLKTTFFNIYPRYEYQKGAYGKRILVGYEVVQRIEIKIRDLAKIGAIIEKATSSGANEASDLQLIIDNQEELKKQAREEAISKAKTKAGELSSQLGVKLGRVVSFSENFYLPYSDTKLYLQEGMGGAGEIPDIQTGENVISVSVSITYEIY